MVLAILFWLNDTGYKSNSNLGELIGFGTGLVMIFLGLRRYREYRLDADIPDLAKLMLPLWSKVHSAALRVAATESTCNVNPPLPVHRKRRGPK